MLPILEMFLKTEAILSLLLVVVVVGFGVWFSRSGWPFLHAYLGKRQELDHQFRMQQAANEAQSDQRWQDISARMVENFASLREEIGAFREAISGFTRSISTNGKG